MWITLISSQGLPFCECLALYYMISLLVLVVCVSSSSLLIKWLFFLHFPLAPLEWVELSWQLNKTLNVPLKFTWWSGEAQLNVFWNHDMLFFLILIEIQAHIAGRFRAYPYYFVHQITCYRIFWTSYSYMREEGETNTRHNHICCGHPTATMVWTPIGWIWIEKPWVKRRGTPQWIQLLKIQAAHDKHPSNLSV